MGLEVGVAWYYKEQWGKIRAHSKDRCSMEKRYEDWESKALETVKNFEGKGYTVHRVYIDVDMLVEWCKRHRVQIDGNSRADYVSFLLANRAGLTSDI